MPSQDEKHYGSGVAFIFIFNLIVGTGALALPSAFAGSGWLISSLIVCAIYITSFISLTFIVESMSIANYICKSSTCFLTNNAPLIENGSEDDSTNDVRTNLITENVERTPLINYSDLSQEIIRDDSHLFDITEKMELAHMVKLFFKKAHLKYFYIAIIVYLYGDLTIYSAAIAKSLRDVTCFYDNCTKAELDSTDLCWQNMSLNRQQVYRLYILVIGIISAFLFNLHIKCLQFLTTIFRWFAFISMIVLTSIALIEGKGTGNPPKNNLSKLPNLFGVCVYSFMCHHSLPRLITPLKNKKHIYRLIFLDYTMVLFFYLLLSLTGIFTFKYVEDVYTLNFQKPRCSSLNAIKESIVPQLRILEIFLPLFPVYTFGNLAILETTLLNNLKALFLKETLSNSNSNLSRESLSVRFLFPLITLLPPIMMSFLSENVELFVGLTGSYGGTFIQYLIPLYLVYNARLSLTKLENEQEQLSLQSSENLNSSFFSTEPKRNLNKSIFLENFQSSFKGEFWIYFILLWSIFCLILVSINHIVFWFNIQI